MTMIAPCPDCGPGPCVKETVCAHPMAEPHVEAAQVSTLAPMPLDEQTTRELSRAAANVRTWTEKRNTLIRAAHDAGGGIREIAKATGLNVGTIHTMIHGRKR